MHKSEINMQKVGNKEAENDELWVYVFQVEQFLQTSINQCLLFLFSGISLMWAEHKIVVYAVYCKKEQTVWLRFTELPLSTGIGSQWRKKDKWVWVYSRVFSGNEIIIVVFNPEIRIDHLRSSHRSGASICQRWILKLLCDISLSSCCVVVNMELSREM